MLRVTAIPTVAIRDRSRYSKWIRGFMLIKVSSYTHIFIARARISVVTLNRNSTLKGATIVLVKNTGISTCRAVPHSITSAPHLRPVECMHEVSGAAKTFSSPPDTTWVNL